MSIIQSLYVRRHGGNIVTCIASFDLHESASNKVLTISRKIRIVIRCSRNVEQSRT